MYCTRRVDRQGKVGSQPYGEIRGAERPRGALEAALGEAEELELVLCEELQVRPHGEAAVEVRLAQLAQPSFALTDQLKAQLQQSLLAYC